MEIVQCPHCSVRVVPMANGSCPSCQCVADPAKALATVMTEPPALKVSTPEVDLNELLAEQSNRNRKGRASMRVAVFWFACAAALTLPLAGFWIYIVTRPFQETSGENEGRLLRGLLFFFSPLISGCGYLGQRSVYNARRLFVPNASLALQIDKRAPVLYLRSFLDDESRSPDFGLIKKEVGGGTVFNFQRVVDEEALARTLQRCLGPVVAIGRPGETLPELGAYRMYFSDEHWKVEVIGLVNRSQLVVLRIGSTGGLLWELKNTVDRVEPEKIILYSNPAQSLPAHFRPLIPYADEHTFPTSRFVYFTENWVPHAADSIDEILKLRLQFKEIHVSLFTKVTKGTKTALVLILTAVLIFWIGATIIEFFRH